MQCAVSHTPLSLFDRLAVDAEPERAFDEVLSCSISRELGRLLTSRSRLSFAAFDKSAGGVLDYGVPDCTSRCVHSAQDREVIAAAIKRAIELFEPRLANVAVCLTPLSCGAANVVVNAVVSVRADVTRGGVMRHMEFEFGGEGYDG